MSADNGYVVSKFHKLHSEKWGIFHYFASEDRAPEWYNEDNAVEVHNNPVHAIVAAHRVERDIHTEYGVHVNSLVLEDCERFGF